MWYNRITDFTMLNAHNLGRFVTLTLWYFVTPKQMFHRFVTQTERGVSEFDAA